MWIIARKDKLLYHFGILLDKEKILHFASKTNNMFAGDQKVKYDEIQDFAISKKVTKVYQLLDSDEKKIIERALKYPGEHYKYSLRNNNCIFFILWCLQIEVKKNFLTVVKYYIMYCSQIWKISWKNL